MAERDVQRVRSLFQDFVRRECGFQGDQSDFNDRADVLLQELRQEHLAGGGKRKVYGNRQDNVEHTGGYYSPHDSSTANTVLLNELAKSVQEMKGEVRGLERRMVEALDYTRVSMKERLETLHRQLLDGVAGLLKDNNKRCGGCDCHNHHNHSRSSSTALEVEALRLRMLEQDIACVRRSAFTEPYRPPPPQYQQQQQQHPQYYQPPPPQPQPQPQFQAFQPTDDPWRPREPLRQSSRRSSRRVSRDTARRGEKQAEAARHPVGEAAAESSGFAPSDVPVARLPSSRKRLFEEDPSASSSQTESVEQAAPVKRCPSSPPPPVPAPAKPAGKKGIMNLVTRLAESTQGTDEEEPEPEVQRQRKHVLNDSDDFDFDYGGRGGGGGGDEVPPPAPDLDAEQLEQEFAMAAFTSNIRPKAKPKAKAKAKTKRFQPSDSEEDSLPPPAPASSSLFGEDISHNYK